MAISKKNKKTLDARLEESFNQYLYFIKKDVFLDAAIEISDIYHCIKYFQMNRNIKERWLEKISRENIFNKANHEKIVRELREDYVRISHIISVGDHWNDDVWVFVLLYRLNLELVKDFFKFKNLPFPELDLHGLCEEMKAFSQTKKNKKVFEFSLSQMQKNSPLPFVDIWFEANTNHEEQKEI